MGAFRLLAGHGRRWGSALALLVSGAVTATACLHAATIPATSEPWRPLAATERGLVEAALAAAEPDLRRAAAEAFPGDRWSADDDFHNHELALVRQLAATQSVPVAAVWDALDDALRLQAQGASGPPVMRATVPPCHPRPTD